ncbi:hypothetical protein [Azospirillum sp.]|uniref:hypothetical protein n=1 Tax=Azospirillum sp. TaxID=34012 RepID=UPI002D360F32|nr:hypothetical protein [Azospirillum sp.]HYF89579.1 hypothetical protein [Azospirillum sp.]
MSQLVACTTCRNSPLTSSGCADHATDFGIVNAILDRIGEETSSGLQARDDNARDLLLRSRVFTRAPIGIHLRSHH